MECCCLFELILAFAVLVAGYWWFSKPQPQPLFGIYRQKGGQLYYLKFLVAYLFLCIRQWFNNGSKGVRSMGHRGKVFDSTDQLENVQPLSQDPKAIDAIFFTGASREGHYCVVAFARRPKRTANAFVFLKLPNMDLLQSHHLPDTMIQTDSDYAFAGEGFNINMIKPFAQWVVKYEGNMRFANDLTKSVDVKLRMTWESQLRHFDFNHNLNPSLMARALAKEPWSDRLFSGLKESHQNHYEQMGIMTGEVEIESQEPISIRMTHSCRDHTFSFKREWKHLHRYILHNVTVEDGSRFMVGVVSMPMFFTSLELGYLYNPSGQLVSIDWCDLPLWYLGETGQAPKDYGFCFRADGKTYEVKVTVEDESQLFIGLKWEARILERLCTFSVNGKHGWGFAEWEYRYRGHRPAKYLT